jgi:hypothetical protein
LSLEHALGNLTTSKRALRLLEADVAAVSYRLAVAAIAIASLAGMAQSNPPCTPGSFPYAYAGIGIQNKTGAPYSATVKMTFEQRLADGNVLHGETLVKETRDSAGRTRREMLGSCVLGKDGQVHERISININDPAAKTLLNWEQDGPPPRVARLNHFQEMPRRTQSPEEKAEMEEWRKTMEAQQPTRREVETVRLGAKDIHGVLAEGTRTTQTIQPGMEGTASVSK